MPSGRWRWNGPSCWSPTGWTDTSKIDSCGCPIFEKPGGGSTTFKSATGHGPDCTQYENFEGHGPLHLWTTDPPPPLDEWLRANGATLTKLQYVALTRYDGDVEAAKIGERITPDSSWVTELPEPEAGPKTAATSQVSEVTQLGGTPNNADVPGCARATILESGLNPRRAPTG